MYSTTTCFILQNNFIDCLFPVNISMAAIIYYYDKQCIAYHSSLLHCTVLQMKLSDVLVCLLVASTAVEGGITVLPFWNLSDSASVFTISF